MTVDMCCCGHPKSDHKHGQGECHGPSERLGTCRCLYFLATDWLDELDREAESEEPEQEGA